MVSNTSMYLCILSRVFLTQLRDESIDGSILH